MKIATNHVLNPSLSKNREYYVIHYLANLFIADGAQFIRWEAGRDTVVLTTSTLGELVPLTPEFAEMAISVLESKDPLAIEDLANSRFAHCSESLKSDLLCPKAVLLIPLVVGDVRIGVVTLLYNAQRPFTRQQLTFARQAGHQIALAMWSVQKDAEAQRSLAEAAALAEISLALSQTEKVSLETVLRQIVDSARALIPLAQGVVLHLIDPSGTILVPRAVAGFSLRRKESLRLRLDQSVAGLALTSGKVVSVPNATADTRFSGQKKDIKFLSLMVAPIRGQERSHGTISIQSNLVDAFNSDDSRLLQALAAQAAIAIENAHLLETTQQSLKEISSLYQVTRRLAASLDSQELMNEVVELLRQTFGYYHVQVYIRDPASGDLVMQAGSGEVGKALKERNHRLLAGEGVVGHTAETGLLFYTNNVDDFHFFIRNPLLPDTKSELAVPVRIGSEILGVLDIQQASSAELSEKDVRLVSAVADQLAIALHKANLYADLERSLRQEQAMRTRLIQSEKLSVAGRLLASVSHELNNPLQAIQNALFLLKNEEGLSLQGQQDLEIVLAETERMATLLERLRTTYQPLRSEDFRPVQINTLIEDVLALVSTHLRHSRIAFDFHPDPELPFVSGIADQLKQVFLNLFLNAADAMPDGGRLTVSTLTLADKREILVTVSDTGTGIDPAILPNIFDAFVSGKERGTGLGLSISNEIIQQHRGRMQAENNPDSGATFKVWLPMARGGDTI